MSPWLILAMLVLGVLLSAFFSGTETGFYRVSRLRLVLDGLAGDPVSRGLLWLTNNPTLFVATTLVGNNLANYVTSLAIVLATARVFGADGLVAQLIAPIVFAPILFVYGESLPKYLFYHVPNRLLRLSGPMILVSGLAFAPITALLWICGRLLRWMIGQSPEQVRLMLARRELVQILEEGHEAGILRPAQRNLAQALFAVASQSVVRLVTPLSRVVTIRKGLSRPDVIRLARRHRLADVPVRSDDKSNQLLGYVRTIDLYLDDGDWNAHIRPLLEIPLSDTHIAAVMKMQSQQETLANVVDHAGATVGLLNDRLITEPLFRGK